jgi:hypothetical protein
MGFSPRIGDSADAKVRQEVAAMGRVVEEEEQIETVVTNAARVEELDKDVKAEQEEATNPLAAFRKAEKKPIVSRSEQLKRSEASQKLMKPVESIRDEAKGMLKHNPSLMDLFE